MSGARAMYPEEPRWPDGAPLKTDVSGDLIARALDRIGRGEAVDYFMRVSGVARGRQAAIRWQPAQIDCGPMTILLGAKAVVAGGEEVPLTTTELRVLAYLLARRGGVAAYVAMVPAVWRRSGEGAEGRNLVWPHVQSLRRKLAGCPEVTIKTVSGRRYRLLLGEEEVAGEREEPDGRGERGEREADERGEGA